MWIRSDFMIRDIDMKIIINGRNREKYEEALNIVLKNGQEITINQHQLLKSSRMEVECECDFCGNHFKKQRVSLKGKTFCDNHCRNENLRKIGSSDLNPNPKKDKVDVKCHICEKEFQVFESKFKKQEVFLCDRDCYKKHRSLNYSGENVYNYQEVFTKCTTCEKEIKTSKWYLDNKINLFCTHNCYWVHRKDFYREFYYSEILNDYRKETKPEKDVREWLTKQGIKFKQEIGFLRKYFVDFYLPEYKLIIEVYGDYWHVNPKIYDTLKNNPSKKPMHKNQEKYFNSNRDKQRQGELESYGYKMCVIWEEETKTILDEKLSSFIINAKNP